MNLAHYTGHGVQKYIHKEGKERLWRPLQRTNERIYAVPARALAAAGPSSPPVLGAGTVFPHGQGFFCMAGPQPGAAALHTSQVAVTAATATGQVRPMTQVWGSHVEALAETL
jgi:hypothetical protein